MCKTLDLLGLSESEIAFVEKVYLNPGCKLNNCSEEWIKDGSTYGKTTSLYKKPEELGLIECIGSYKWKPTSKIKMIIVTNI